MFEWIRRIQIDRLSFWLGFLAGVLFWWLVGLFRAQLPEWRKALKARNEQRKLNRLSGVEDDLRRETLKRAQANHITARYFALNEIIIPPRVLTPRPNFDPNEVLTTHIEMYSHAFPYLPDCPELYARLEIPATDLIDILREGTRVAIIGLPGSGKSVALAYIASQLAQRSPTLQPNENRIPYYLHTSDLQPFLESPQYPLSIIAHAITTYVSPQYRSQISTFVTSTFEADRAYLLLDGLDEIPQNSLALYYQFISQLLELYPTLPILVAASPYLGKLTKMGFEPVVLALWNSVQTQSFIDRWQDAWSLLEPLPELGETSSPEIPHILLNRWLKQEVSSLSPLEITLGVWAAFSGDSSTKQPQQTIESYLRRLSTNSQNYQTLQELATNIIRSGTPFYLPASKTSPSAERVITELPPSSQSTNSPEINDTLLIDPSVPLTQQHGILDKSPFDWAIENNIISKQHNGSYRFVQPAIAAYLAAKIEPIEEPPQLIIDPSWEYSLLYWQYRCGAIDISSQVNKLLEKDSPALQPLFFRIARWLPYSLPTTSWRTQTLRTLAEIVQKGLYPFQIRLSALNSLINSRETNIQSFFKQLLTAPLAEARSLGILGFGAIQDTRVIDDLYRLYNDPDRLVQIHACIALNSIGTQSAIEKVARGLLEGSEDLRQTAAEALATRPGNGWEILKEGATFEDLLTRRAVVYGLAQIKEPWARELLEKISIEDGQWVVRNAAAQTLEALDKPHPKLAQPLPQPWECPWLIAFASQRGIGIPPGAEAVDILLMAIKTGTEEEQTAAADYLKYRSEAGIVGALYDRFYGQPGISQAAAAYALWFMCISGVQFPHPNEFGFG